MSRAAWLRDEPERRLAGERVGAGEAGPDAAAGLGCPEIAAIGCYNGLQAQGGAASVGQATTRTVVLASICVLISDFFLTKLFLAI